MLPFSYLHTHVSEIETIEPLMSPEDCEGVCILPPSRSRCTALQRVRCAALFSKFTGQTSEMQVPCFTASTPEKKETAKVRDLRARYGHSAAVATPALTVHADLIALINSQSEVRGNVQNEHSAATPATASAITPFAKDEQSILSIFHKACADSIRTPLVIRTLNLQALTHLLPTVPD